MPTEIAVQIEAVSTDVDLRQTRTIVTVVGGRDRYGGRARERDDSNRGQAYGITYKGDVHDQGNPTKRKGEASQHDKRDETKKGGKRDGKRHGHGLPHPCPAPRALRIRAFVQQRALREPDRRALMQAAAGRALRAQPR